jgi:LysM repeat protein
MKNLLIILFCAVSALFFLTGCQSKLAESPYGAREQGWEEFIKNTYPDWEPPHTVPPEKGVMPLPQDNVPVIISENEVVIETIDPTIDAAAAQQDIEAAEINITSEFQTYTVQKGDTLWKISRQFYGSGKEWRKIFQANQDTVSNPDKIKAGIEIRIPASQ